MHPGPSRHIRPSSQTVLTRSLVAGFALLCALTAGGLMVVVSAQDGLRLLDALRVALIFLTTGWLAWGASLAFIGLMPFARRPAPQIQGAQPATVILVPICNEDPVETFARIAAIDASLADAHLTVDIAILSDTRDPERSARERGAFARLQQMLTGQGRVYYRIRPSGAGRKAGNVEDFMRNSGGAYEFAVILDADSLMSGEAIRAMIARMMADPRIGLLQTLPRIIGARSLFGRAMQFSAAFNGGVFTRGLCRLQGHTGPFWGHNAIVRTRAFAESCGLPDLPGKAPFGGHILSHDYVEAALLARAGWKVEVDPTIDGSYEEGPENLLSFAKRDRRWCQGNLQHSRLVTAPGLAGWSRFVFIQGIMAYIAAPLWALLLLSTLAATALAPPPDYFPEPHQLFPTFPLDRTLQITALILGTVGLLILPKFAIWAEAVLTDRAEQFGGPKRALASMIAELILSSLMAPLMLMYQTRAVLQVLSGQDGGWPANARGEGILHVLESLRACYWIALFGGAAWLTVHHFAPELAPWILPLGIPMILAPLLIAWTSRPLTHKLFQSPEELNTPEIVDTYNEIRARWHIAPAAEPDAAPIPAVASHAEA